ncbi:MAG: hypothetical protein C5B59_18455 [Bacteroidetes bacterium]|nr:MAG: hypothetical protein C5B59_18455 [Bacteroidota bacterium]
MIDRYDLTKKLLALVDGNPLANVDIAPIIAEQSVDLTFNQQKNLRVTIMNILRELREGKEIDFYDGDFMITSSQGETFMGNGGKIRSTYKRQNEIEKKTQNSNAKKIQLSTRRNILDAFLITRITWYGNLDQRTFLGRLYDLTHLPSNDSRYETASEDIQRHTVLNDDWPVEWVFTDNRFNILHAPDKEFLDFLCLTLHPAVRTNKEELTTLVEIYINNLKRDGFTLEKSEAIVGHPIFSPVEIGFVKSTPGSTTGSVKSEIRKALVVGCSSYEHANSLVNPLNDANGMESMLSSLAFEVTKKIDPSQKELKVAIDEFGDKLKGSDVGLFYFAGHGVQVKGLNYLIPIDAKLAIEKLVEYDCVEAGRLLAYMEEARTSVNFLILDACRNNPFERSWARGINQRGLAMMNAPKGSLIAYSTSPGNTASDGSGNNGLYTEALLNYMPEKGLPVTTLFQKVRLEVMDKSKEEQIPWESTSLTADFYFNR